MPRHPFFRYRCQGDGVAGWALAPTQYGGCKWQGIAPAHLPAAYSSLSSDVRNFRAF